MGLSILCLSAAEGGGWEPSPTRGIVRSGGGGGTSLFAGGAGETDFIVTGACALLRRLTGGGGADNIGGSGGPGNDVSSFCASCRLSFFCSMDKDVCFGSLNFDTRCSFKERAGLASSGFLGFSTRTSSSR